MPEWLEEYRDLVESGCGGNSAETLLNDKTANYFNNPLLCELIGICQGKVNLITKLKEDGLLLPRTMESDQ